MTRVLFIRHGRTDWNDQRRIQGHTDIPLNPAGKAEVGKLRLPPEYRHWPAYSSPLERALETARLLGLEAPMEEPRLMEMNYGSWEGATWHELVRRYGEEAIEANTRRGIDFRPEDGESPAELKLRLSAWLEDMAALKRDVVAVTHKGVIRMALAMATGWDLTSRPPARLQWERGHLFSLPEGAGGPIRVDKLNLTLEPE